MAAGGLVVVAAQQRETRNEAVVLVEAAFALFFALSFFPLLRAGVLACWRAGCWWRLLQAVQQVAWWLCDGVNNFGVSKIIFLS